MSMIQVNDLTFQYEGSYDPVFTHASFTIDTDWKTGFVGRNGRGKTTFLNLLLGKYPYQGSIITDAAFDYFPFDPGETDRTTRQVMEALLPEEHAWRIEREMNLLEVPEEALERAFCTLSNGERTKALLAALFLRENEFLLIDEPTNHLDMEARRVVARYLAAKKGFLLVSHDRAFLDACVDHILSINRANIEVQKGNFSSWLENKRRQDAWENAQNDQLLSEIGRMQQAARRTAGWSDAVEKTKREGGDSGYAGHKAAKMMQRAKNLERRQQAAITEKQQLLQNIDKNEPLKIHPLTFPTERLAQLSDVSISYGGRTVVTDLNLTVRRGERIALIGKNGAGKSSVLKMILKQRDVPHTGTVWTGAGLKISYVPQDTSFLSGALDDYASREQVDMSLCYTILRKMGFSRIQFEKDMRAFSAGQRKKVLLAVSLATSAHLYIWDEPLNYIDVISRMQIEELLLLYKPTILFVEHDRTFFESIATRVIRLP